eukprot:TRINITY_DN71757_c0_g1_i1.p1 TRINITY_DN71757_c0_g1~~TRINITY_DN71757_c0_g1_i1.p1  ORF type:complete len:247 (-),score=52.18 TRINITY_DN71757_c0_g1_i1:62-802(-)
MIGFKKIGDGTRLPTQPGKPTQFILDEDDVLEDPFKVKRENIPLGQVPIMKKIEPGMNITTIEVPALGELKLWHNFLHQLQIATGVVVLRGLGQTLWDKDMYVMMNEMFAEICEVVEARPTFIINIAKGDVRSQMMTLPALADVSLAEPDATFGFPDVRLGGLPAITSCCMRKRVSDDAIKKLITNGEPIDAREAQRIGLVDFVGDVETELARLIFRNCKPKVTEVMYRPDCEKAWQWQEDGEKSS